ncbi:MAG TPA: hypothetical protein VK158_05755 [Acidobacteriota bacterium]|nr:hypothetical protein [Acidobacteriota bacterium]
MAITPVCDKCKKELVDYGALFFSPPIHNTVKKYHICKACYEILAKDLR